jgi:DNA-binding MarR family transcriptional regulator
MAYARERWDLLFDRPCGSFNHVGRRSGVLEVTRLYRTLDYPLRAHETFLAHAIALHAQETYHVSEQNLHIEFTRLLADAFSAEGWNVDREQVHRDRNRTSTIDLVVARGELRYAVELKTARDGRGLQLESLLANAILQANWRAKLAGNGCTALAVVGAPAISNRIVQDLKEYVETVTPGQPYGIIDARGRLNMFGEGLSDLKIPTLQGTGDLDLPADTTPDLFSDRNQWALKVLLAARLPAQLLVAPDAPIETGRALAGAAGISTATASRLIGQLKDEGFLDRNQPPYKLVRVKELLARWRAVQMKACRELRVKFLISGRDPKAKLNEALRRIAAGRVAQEFQIPRWTNGPRVCLGLFAACDHLGLGFVQGVAPYIYVDNLTSDLIVKLGLRVAESGEHADAIVREAAWPESIFRGVIVDDGVPVTDVLQAWLDVSSHPARGEEQANHLMTRALSTLFTMPMP